MWSSVPLATATSSPLPRRTAKLYEVLPCAAAWSTICCRAVCSSRGVVPAALSGAAAAETAQHGRMAAKAAKEHAAAVAMK